MCLKPASGNENASNGMTSSSSLHNDAVTTELSRLEVALQGKPCRGQVLTAILTLSRTRMSFTSLRSDRGNGSGDIQSRGPYIT
jgi:hypothetical protein